ncbi:MAG: hypothetical protein Kow002_13700 [Anaerolineales bacterium]
MENKKPLISFSYLLAALGGIPAIIGFVRRSTSEDPILFGLSAPRLVVFVGMILLLLAFLAFTVLSFKGKGILLPLSKKHFKLTLALILLLSTITYIFAFLPNYRLGNYAAHVDNLRPVFFWAFGVSLLFSLILLLGHFGSHPDLWLVYWKSRRGALLTGLTAAGLMVLVGIAGITFKIIEHRHEDFWYSTGVPLLAWQVTLAILLGTLIPRFIKKDKIVFIMLWVLAGLLWALWPYRGSFSMSQLLPPNFESYPIYDSIYYDQGSQFALIGEGINGGMFTDRPLYMFFLFLLHLAVGQDFTALENLQAALFAIFPAIIYLLGVRLHSRQAGMTAGVFIVFRGINSLAASPWIDNSHLKNILIDFPTAIALATFTLLIVRALKSKTWTDLLGAAGTLGLATMLRLHVLIFLPLLAGAAIYLLLIRQPWKRWLSAGALLSLGLSTILLPWLLWNNTSITEFLGSRLKSMFEQRYTPSESHLLLMKERARSTQPTRPEFAYQRVSVADIPFQGVHFLHNLMVTPFSLPTTFELHDIRTTVKENPYWYPKWDGHVETSHALMLALSLLIAALGIGTATQKGRFAGLTPALVLLGYYAANSFARTSGGRYLVPVDWVLYLYLAVGWVEIFRAGSAYFGKQAQSPVQMRSTPRSIWSKGTGVVLGVLLAIGLMIPLIPELVRPVYPQKLRKHEVIKLVNTTDLWKLTSLSQEEIREFRTIPESVAIRGRALYPIYFKQDDGLPLEPKFTQRIEPYPRLVFNVIGPKTNLSVILPSTTTPELPHTADVIVIGCKEQFEIQALAIILPAQKTAYMRSPEAPLTCPLRIPVCDDNKVCK